MRTMLGLALLVVMGAATAADDKVDAKKLIGKWTIAKDDVKAQLEFAKDGKMKYTLEIKGKETKIDGTYKLDGSKLSVTMKFMDVETTKDVTIKKLTDEELVTDDGKGKENTFKRAK